MAGEDQDDRLVDELRVRHRGAVVVAGRQEHREEIVEVARAAPVLADLPQEDLAGAGVLAVGRGARVRQAPPRLKQRLPQLTREIILPELHGAGDRVELGGGDPPAEQHAGHDLERERERRRVDVPRAPDRGLAHPPAALLVDGPEEAGEAFAVEARLDEAPLLAPVRPVDREEPASDVRGEHLGHERRLGVVAVVGAEDVIDEARPLRDERPAATPTEHLVRVAVAAAEALERPERRAGVAQAAVGREEGVGAGDGHRAKVARVALSPRAPGARPGSWPSCRTR